MAVNAVITVRAARLSGFAPHPVLFDSIASTSDATTRPFHDAVHIWSFGDPAGGAVHARGSRSGTYSKNAATGPVTGHMFETGASTPINYTVTLNVWDGGFVGVDTETISVQDQNSYFPTTNTICVRYDTTHDFTGAPAGSQQITQTNFQTIIDTYALDGNRVLFQCQDTWTSAGATIDDNGTGAGRVIGKFGPGTTKPVFVPASGGQCFVVSHAASPDLKKVTFQDFEISGLSLAQFGFLYFGSADDITFFRIYVHDMTNVGISAGDANRVGDHYPIGLYIIESDIGFCANNGFIGGATENLVIGSDLHDGTNSASHCFRNGAWNKLALLHSNFRHGGDCITLRSLDYTVATNVWPVNWISMYGYIGFNYLEGSSVGDASTILMSFRPVSDPIDARMENAIVEGNHLVWNNSAVASGMQIRAREITVRNNFFDKTAGTAGVGMNIGRTGIGIEPVPRGINILNNTIVTNGTAATTGADFNSTCTNNGGANPNNAKGNLVYAPNVTSPVSVADASSSVTISDNTGNPVTENPSFPAFPWVTLSDAIPGTVTNGSSVHLYLDGFQRSRNGVTNQRGAYQYVEGSYPWITVASAPSTLSRRVIGLTWT